MVILKREELGGNIASRIQRYQVKIAEPRRIPAKEIYKYMGFTEEIISEQAIRREKEKARHLRHSAWWMRKIEKGVCYYCNREVGKDDLTMDHVVPLSRGGKSKKGNVVTACKECNNKKKYLLPIEWEEYLQSLRDKPSSL